MIRTTIALGLLAALASAKDQERLGAGAACQTPKCVGSPQFIRMGSTANPGVITPCLGNAANAAFRDAGAGGDVFAPDKQVCREVYNHVTASAHTEFAGATAEVTCFRASNKGFFTTMFAMVFGE